MTDQITVNIGKQFSRYPVGRYRSDGDANGEKFREDVLRPALTRASKIVIEFDDALGYGSSFLEEAFGGLVRHGFKSTELLRRLQLVTADDSLKSEVISYINEALAGNA